VKDYHDDSGWWGGRGRGENRLTVLDLIRANTLDVDMAALLWLLVERKSSIVVAAMPQLAGKTTLLTAIMDLAPPRYEKVYTRGMYEDFSFLAETDPTKTYVMVPELSNHTPFYLWGDAVRRLFEQMARGYSMAATMHADSPEEVLDMLGDYPVNVPRSLFHHLHVIVNLRLLYSEHGLVRRVGRLTLVTPGPKFVPVDKWDPDTDAFIHSDSAEARAALGKRLLTTRLDTALAHRAEALRSWLTRGPMSASELQQLVARHYASLPSAC
jgi:hypothetical protein